MGKDLQGDTFSRSRRQLRGPSRTSRRPNERGRSCFVLGVSEAREAVSVFRVPLVR